MRDFVKDVWTIVRSLVRQPELTAVVVLTLALGIGAATALFAYLATILWPTIDAPGADRIVWFYTGSADEPEAAASYPEYLDLQRQQGSVTSLTASSPMGTTVANGSTTVFAWGNLVSGGYFSFFGAHPAVGRLFQPGDDRPGAEPVAVVTFPFWKSVLGGDPAAVGRPLRINGRTLLLVGVTQDGFQAPGISASIFVPVVQTDWITGLARLENRKSRWLNLLGRLSPAVSLQKANAAVGVAAYSLDQSAPLPDGKRVFSLKPVSSYDPNPQVDRYLAAARILMAVALLFLLLACANVTNLLLARATARRREWGIRAALGASRRRLIAGAFTESLVLCLAAGAAGLLIAVALARRIETYLQTALGGLGSISAGSTLMRLDARAYGFALLVAGVCGLLCGVAPMLNALRGDLLGSVKADAGGTAQSAGLTVRRLLVVVQVGLSALLLLAGSLLVRSLRNAQHTDPGFDPKGLLYATMYVPRSAGSDGVSATVYPRIQETAAQVAGVRSATLALVPPLAGWSRPSRFASREHPDQWQTSAFNIVGPGYFDVLGLKILKGRALDSRDRKNTSPSVVINETLAKKLWDREDPIGRFLTSGEPPRTGELGPDFQVVGVVKDTRMVSAVDLPEPTLYFAYDQHKHSRMTLVVRAAVPPSSLLPSLRAAARSAHPDLAFVDVTTSDEQMQRSLFPQRMYAEIAGLLGFLGLIVAVVGLFGLLSYTVSLRVRELGIRMAIGAHPDDVLRLVLRQGLGLAAAGVMLGILGALALTHLLRSLLVGVDANDPFTFAIVASILAFVALCACYLPAQRASQLDPLAALRQT
ncbi:MAG TPA: ADOP family duplicated permease [Thermoanaerobaculia bacterium]|nr:ADOP family duplicated permease [Thermoanaerobaculia bacterium]